MVRQHASQQQGLLGIVRWLAGNRVPSTSLGKFTDAFRVFPPDVVRLSELNKAAQSVSGKLAEQTALGTLYYLCCTFSVSCVARLSQVIDYPFGG